LVVGWLAAACNLQPVCLSLAAHCPLLASGFWLSEKCLSIVDGTGCWLLACWRPRIRNLHVLVRWG
jgi:hypothetical protein